MKDGKVRFVYKHFPIIELHDPANRMESTLAAEAAECANTQGKFWPYHDALFALETDKSGQPLGLENRGDFSAPRLKDLAAQLGLDTSKFNQCLDSNQFASAVRADQAEGQQLGVQGTPTVFVNGKQVDNPLDWNQLQAAVQTALQGK